MYDYMDKIYILEPPRGRKDLGESTFEEVLEQFHHAARWAGQFYMHLRG
jgi:hypothetical protein